MRCARRAIARSAAARAAAAALRASSWGAPANRISDAGAAAIAEALKINKTVATIDLSCALSAARDRAECCGARGGGCAARKLMGAPDNSIGDAGAAAIAEALKINKTVTNINLSSALCAARDRAECGGARGGVGAARKLMGAPDNSIGDAGAAAIAEALKINKTVTTIDLKGALCATRDRAECCGARSGGGAARKLMRGGGGAPDNRINIRSGTSAFASALLLNVSVRVVGGICGLDAELASSYRIPHVRFLVRMRALCLSERGVGTEKDVVVVWVASRAPLWVLVRVCGLICDVRV